MYRIVLPLLLLLLSVDAVTAQPRMIVSGELATVEVSLDTGATRPLPRTAGAVGGVPVDGGRYLLTLINARPGALVIQAWAPRTGETLTTPPLPTAPGDGAPSIVGDTSRPRAFIWNQHTISIVTQAGVQGMVDGVAPIGAGSYRPMAYSPLSETLFVLRQQSTGIELAQYDISGALMRATPLPAAHVPTALAATSDGATVFVRGFDTVAGRAQILRYDASSGMLSASAIVGFDFGEERSLMLDESNHRVLFSTRSFLEVRTFDLVLVNTLHHPAVATCRFDAGVDERTGTVFVATTALPYSYADYSRVPTVSALDVAASSVLGSVTLTSPSPDSLVGSVAPCGGGSVVLTPPVAPAMEPPTIVGTEVTLSWPAVRNATDYQLEASIGTGAPIFTARTSGHTSISVASVPPGSYTVRVRGVNDSGVGTLSEPVLVTVP